MGNLAHDLQFTFRQLRKEPGFALTAVLTLALGIGVNTAIFSIVNSILLAPLPVANPQQIATITYRQNRGPLQRSFSWPEFRDIRAQSHSAFSDVFAVTAGMDGFAMEGQKPERITTAYISGNFFNALGVKPAAGRLFLPGEGAILNSDPIVVLGYDFWKKRFNGDPNVVGQQVTVDGHSVSVVGIAPKSFHGLPNIVITVAAYLPLSQLTIEGTPADVLNSWKTRNLSLYGRLRPDVTLEQASADLGVVAQNMMRLHPDDERQLDLAAYAEPTLRIVDNPSTIYLVSALFLGLAGMVLLLACVNVANLVLVRATVREREIATRAALGASRSRLLAQMITESLTLGLMGGVVGVGLGLAASIALSRINLHLDLPISLPMEFDWRIFLFSFAMALLAGIAIGIVPALRIARTDMNTFLREGGRSLSRGRHWLRDGLVIMQIAGSIVLLIVAGLFVRSIGTLKTMDFGFNPNHVLNLSLDPSLMGMNDEQARDLTSSIRDKLHQLAEVDAVSQATQVPMGYISGRTDALIIDGAPAPNKGNKLTAGYNIITPEYFSVMGIKRLRGRTFTGGDNEQSRDVAVISQSMANRYWPHQDPIGHTFRVASDKAHSLEVVGIAHDVEISSTELGRSNPYFYIPYAQHIKGNRFTTLQVRTKGDPLASAGSIEKAIHSIAPLLPVFQVQSMREALYSPNGLLLFQLGATFAAVMGGLGLTLAVIGLYGVISYVVSQRVYEIGIRMALGATRGSVFSMIYFQSMRIVTVGLAFGLAIALLVSRAVGSFVIVKSWDPVTYAGVIGLLVAVALAACFLPAHRAMSLEPSIALRQD